MIKIFKRCDMKKYYRYIAFIVTLMLMANFFDFNYAFAEIESNSNRYYNFDSKAVFSHGGIEKSPLGDYESDMSFRVPYESEEGIDDNPFINFTLKKLAVITFDLYFDKFNTNAPYGGWRVVQGKEARGEKGDYIGDGANWVQLGSVSQSIDDSGTSAYLRDPYSQNTEYILKAKKWYTIRYSINCDNGTVKCFIAPKGEPLEAVSFHNSFTKYGQYYFDEYTSYQNGGRGYESITFKEDENGKKISYTYDKYSESVTVFQFFKNTNISMNTNIYCDNFYIESYNYPHEYASGLTNDNVDDFFEFNDKYGFIAMPAGAEFDIPKFKTAMLNKSFAADQDLYDFCNNYFDEHINRYDGKNIIFNADFDNEEDLYDFITSDDGCLSLSCGPDGYDNMLKVNSQKNSLNIKLDDSKYSNCKDEFYVLDFRLRSESSYDISFKCGDLNVFELKDGIPINLNSNITDDFKPIDTKSVYMRIVLNQELSIADIYIKNKNKYIKVYTVQNEYLAKRSSNVFSFDVSPNSEFYLDELSLYSYSELRETFKYAAYMPRLYNCIKKYAELGFYHNMSDKFEYISKDTLIRYLCDNDFSSVNNESELESKLNIIYEDAFANMFNIKNDYVVDSENGIITNIIPGTKVAELKEDVYVAESVYTTDGLDAKDDDVIKDSMTAYDSKSNKKYNLYTKKGYVSNFSSTELFDISGDKTETVSAYLNDINVLYDKSKGNPLNIANKSIENRSGKYISVKNIGNDISYGGTSLIIDMKKYLVRSCYAADFCMTDNYNDFGMTIKAKSYNDDLMSYEILKFNIDGSMDFFGTKINDARRNGRVRYCFSVSADDNKARLFVNGEQICETAVSLQNHLLDSIEISVDSILPNKSINFENIDIHEISSIDDYDSSSASVMLYSTIFDVDNSKNVIYIDGNSIKTSTFKAELFSDNKDKIDILKSDGKTKFNGTFIDTSAIVRVFSLDRLSYKDYSISRKITSAANNFELLSIADCLQVSAPVLKYEGKEVNYITDDEYAVEAVVKNDGDTDVKSLIVSAQYTGDKLIGMDLSDVFTVSRGETKELSTKIIVSNAETVKLAVLDAENILRPLSKHNTYTINPQNNLTKAKLLELYMGNSYNVHPKVFANGSDWNRLEKNTNNDVFISSRHNKLIERADNLLETITFDPDEQELNTYIGYKMITGDRLLTIATRVVDFSYTLGYAYKTTKDTKYAEKLWEIYERAGYTENADVENKQEFPDWHPTHYLDTAEMTHGFAVGLDWLDDYWNAEQKEFLQKSIAEYGIKPCYNTDTGKAADLWWMSTDTNWNAVCCGGMIVGSVCLLDSEKYRDMALEVLQKNILEIRNSLHHFAPDGGWGEGVGYWDYEVRYLMYALKTLDNTFNTDFGYSDISGIKNTGLYAMYMMGLKGINNYHDGSEHYYGSSVLFYLSGKTNNPVFGSLWNRNIDKHNKTVTAMDMLLYDEKYSTYNPMLSESAYFADIEAFSMRDSWTNDKSSFLSAHAGKNDEGHAHYDCGTFVYDENGVRWAMDIGGEDYLVTDYFGNSRYKYYRTRTEGHNCIIINPSTDNGAGQEYVCSTEVVEQNGRKTDPYYVMDLTDAYRNSVNNYIRGTMLLSSGGFLIRDEVSLKEDSTVYWFMHTRCDVNVLDNNHVELIQGNKKMILTFDTNAMIDKLEVTDAKSLKIIDSDFDCPDYPYSDESDSNDGVRKVMLKLKTGKNLYINAKCVSENAYFDSEYESISTWKEN